MILLSCILVVGVVVGFTVLYLRTLRYILVQILIGPLASRKVVETKSRAKRKWILDLYSLAGKKCNSKRMIMCSSSAGRVNKWLCYVTSLCPLSLNTTKVAPGYKYIQKILKGHPILQKHLSILIIFRLLFCGFIFLQIRNWQIKHFVGLCIGVTSHSPVESTWKSSASLKAEGKSKFLRPQSWSFSKQVSRQQGLSHPQATFGNLVIFNDMKSLSEHFKFMTTVPTVMKML